MEKDNRFSITGRLRSLGYALRGLVSVFRSEHNMWLHLLATILVTGLCFGFPVSLVELMLIVIVTGLVWAAEIFNTVIEKVMDFISPAKDERIKRIKDMSAAAVLVSALVALITGCIVFIPKMI